ncbi:MAG: exonuclease SbcCD subunit D C-terminal domain-containing protein, partial [Cocleimonas sp.]|nr:exonuclease SbcCD subunit D C-terminal domain-containing protein [Cocleimonas sp.]
DAFPASAFPPVDYMALGHIHNAQLVAKSEHIRYSGSPIALSFDETSTKKAKSVVLVEFKKDQFKQAVTLAVPCFQAMSVVKGDLITIEKTIKQRLEVSEFNDEQTLWLDIEVASQDYLNDVQQRLQKITADLPVEILLLRREQKNKQLEIVNEEKATLNELSVEDVFARRLKEEDWETEAQQQCAERLMVRFKQIVDTLKA